MSRRSIIWAGATLLLATTPTLAAHPGGDVPLRSASGAVISAGSNVPMSPKQTCGGCHAYEGDPGVAVKQQTVQGTAGTPYSVPYAQHGVSAGFHFQQGMNVPWGDTQRAFYGQPTFTSSPGMYGKICPPSNRQLADPQEPLAGKIDLTTEEYRTGGCAWCHPGGGPLEYDREGYRFDGAAGLFQSGANPSAKVADYYIFGTQAGADASAYAGSGFFEVTATTGIFPADQLINMGTVKAVVDPSTGTTKTVGKKYSPVTAGGVAEAECMMCHYAGRYANLERNYAFPGATSPKLAASLGLVGQGTGEPGLLTIGSKGSPGVNPNPSPTGWSWNEFVGTPGVAGNPVTLRAEDIVAKPRVENCALCHFPDRSMASLGCADPSKCGPSSKPLGFTAFQKYMAPGSTRDTDEIPGVNGKDGNNDVAWNAVKGRVEGGKRGESIRDNLNHDAHMKWPAVGDGMDCAECHYALEGDFPALTDSLGNIIQPAVTVSKIDHQFAKGDNTPDGKNMDQLDDTVTCQACHIDFSHPASGNAPTPGAEHAGFPAFHFDLISCKTCHIPVVNGPVDQDVADYMVGPYQTFERTQTLEAPATGINRKPLLLWQKTEHGTGKWQIKPHGVMSTFVVASATSQVGEEAGSVVATYQRLGKKAAEQLRAQYGDANGDGVYDWPLNRLQGGDKVLIVNTPTEITDFLNQVSSIAGAPANPVLHAFFNQFSISHNVRPRAETTNKILGSKSAGGCTMCHSSSDPSSPNYSALSVGFFDRTYSLFDQPVDGGAGLVQTVTPSNPPFTGSLERLNLKFPYKTPDGVSRQIDLDGTEGQTVRNFVKQGEVLGYDANRVAQLTSPKKSTYTVGTIAGSNGTVTPLGDIGVPARRDQSVAITPDPGYRIVDVVVDGNSVGAVGSYTFESVVDDHTLEAIFAPNGEFAITATAGTGGTVSPAGTTTVLGGADVTYTITPDAGFRIATLTVDGEPKPPYSTYYFRDVEADHTIAATFEADTFTLTASTRGSGSISPSGATEVARNGTQTYVITPDPGWKVSRVIVNGVNKGAISSYTFDNVSSDGYIKAYFVLGTSSPGDQTRMQSSPRRTGEAPSLSRN
jgi:hypothetical protein